MNTPTIHKLNFRFHEDTEGKEDGAPSMITISCRATLDNNVTAPVGIIKVLRFWSDMMVPDNENTPLPRNTFLPNNYNMLFALDDYDGDTGLIMEELEAGEDEDGVTGDFFCSLLSSDLFYLERITVNEYWRSQGIGTQMLSALPELLRKKTKTPNPAIILIPAPYEMKIEDEGYSLAKDKLCDWYTRHGYTPLFPESSTMVWF